MRHDEEFYRKLLERLVLRFQGVDAFMGRIGNFGIPDRPSNNLAVRAMIEMIAHAVIEEVKAIEGNEPRADIHGMHWPYDGCL